ncbi:MAG: hypothetical protein JWQ08_1633, partial [Deinococcus sp.]|nr:hypothetical protein [Deinococcus sp.]
FVAAGDTASEATYSLFVPLPEDARPLSPVEDQVLAYLLGRKETLGNIVAALPLSKSAVVQALISLDERGLVSCRFVGHLAIFSRHT